MITVMMATYNGARLLPKVLNAYLLLISPKGGWKLVVIDNGSQDGTFEIVKSFQDKLPLTLLQEIRQGKNAALNTGLKAREGELVVFTDDDTIPDPRWLLEFEQVSEENKNFDIFGGTILPEWEVAPPLWVLTEIPLGPAFTVLNLPQSGSVDAHKAFGPNFAVRSRVFDQPYSFNESIGPKGKNYPMGSETEFIMRLVKAGYRVWFCKSAVVHHIIRENQLHISWLMGRAKRFGRGQYFLHQSQSQYSSWFGIPRYLFRDIAKHWLLFQKKKWTAGFEKSIASLWELNYLMGKAFEAKQKSQEM